MRSTDGAARQQFAIDAGELHLARMWPHGMDALVERRVAALDCIHRHRPGDNRCLHDLLRIDKGVERNCR